MRKEKKLCTNWEEDIKLSLFADDITFYIENLKESTKILLDLVSDYGNVPEHEVNNTQKSVACLILAVNK